MGGPWDAIVVGGGHNGLVAAAYLAKAGLRTLVFERRAIVGGACITEEVFPGVRFSRLAYSAGLLRPEVIRDLGRDLYRCGSSAHRGGGVTGAPGRNAAIVVLEDLKVPPK